MQRLLHAKHVTCQSVGVKCNGLRMWPHFQLPWISVSATPFSCPFSSTDFFKAFSHLKLLLLLFPESWDAEGSSMLFKRTVVAYSKFLIMDRIMERFQWKLAHVDGQWSQSMFDVYDEYAWDKRFYFDRPISSILNLLATRPWLVGLVNSIQQANCQWKESNFAIANSFSCPFSIDQQPLELCYLFSALPSDIHVQTTDHKRTTQICLPSRSFALLNQNGLRCLHCSINT